jgi:hypothetical protein
MSLILRIDVDRPYGKQGLLRHIASRLRTDYYLPRFEWLRYLDELKTILRILNANGRQAHVYFRKCSYPSQEVTELMQAGGHQFGLHLENSRTEETFREELQSIEQALDHRITTVSKHGSGDKQYGLHHYAPYEPERYLEWARKAGMKAFLGNLEDPRIEPEERDGLIYFPAAFWLEPYWRDTERFPLAWLLDETRRRDVVMLMHADNVTSDPEIMREFVTVVETLETTLLPGTAE